MNGVDFFASADVNSGNPSADAADEFIVEAVRRSGNGFHGDGFFPIGTHQGHPVSGLCLGISVTSTII